ncbi:APC family permease [Sandaracinobacteroides saxicola]|uniref:APC family permease n=1 Tax=Sandaracinobacteroides saxicola TaxID=2759707 RepID=A0A7G5ILQ9_9SPHN|nr:APC family permease [Sandaracinobacteroides saxicola]QMW24301.1 APC family permease [Sandaracinobacteroides saxicola]
MVIGAGIFKTSANVAGLVPDERWILALWGVGGLLALAGALCYAELSAAFAHKGGDYWFLRQAYGRSVAFLFAWSRFAVIFTASTALLAFVLADYVGSVLPLGDAGKAAVAAGAVLLLSFLNLRGVRVGANTQLGLVVLDIAALLLLGLAAVLTVAAGTPAVVPGIATPPGLSALGGAVVFIMLAYGGWNDAATLSSELKGGPRRMVPALAGGMAMVTGLYLLANWGYLKVLGVSGLAASAAPAAETAGRFFGPVGELAMVGLVSATALAVMNALIIVGGRTLYAAACDQPLLAKLAAWDEAKGVPRAAIYVQTVMALLLIGWGSLNGRGFAQMVEFLSPVFWLFLTLSAVAHIVLRVRQPDVPRPFRTPLYPLLPLLFAGSSAGILLSSLLYVGIRGVTISFGVLSLGLLFLAVAKLSQPRP